MLHSSSKALEIKCGEGQFLSRIHQRSNADCLGIDINQSCIETAKQNALGEILRFLLNDVKDAPLEKRNFDLAVCIDSTHAFSQGEWSYTNALKQMSERAKPNSLILLGE